MSAVKLIPDVRGNHGGDRVFIDGRKCSVSSVRRYAEYNVAVYGESEERVEKAIARAKARGDKMVWVSLESGVICGDPGFYEREDAKWADAPRISSGDCIDFDGEVFRVEPDFNRNFKLVAAPAAVAGAAGAALEAAYPFGYRSPESGRDEAEYRSDY